VSQGNPSAAKFFEDKKNQLIKKHKKIEDFQEAMDRATTTFDAYLAVNGIEKEKFDQQLPPTSNGGIFDPAQPMIDEEQVSGGGISTGSAQTGERTGRFDHLLR
jgi:3-oxoacyl-[acyl-carrier-protein] synthase III